MLDYGPHTAVDHTDAVTAKPGYPKMLYLQNARPCLTSPYAVTETAEKILLQLIGTLSYDPMARLTKEETIIQTAKEAMDIAKALHSEFRKYEDEIAQAEMVKAIEEVNRNQHHQEFMMKLVADIPPQTPRPDFT